MQSAEGISWTNKTVFIAFTLWFLLQNYKMFDFIRFGHILDF